MPGGSKRKRKGLVWVLTRDGTETHPAHLLDDDDGAPDFTWIEWASNGAVVQIPRSRIAPPLASRRSRSNAAGRSGSGRSAVSRASRAAQVHQSGEGPNHASTSAAPSPVASAVVGRRRDAPSPASAAAPSPVLSSSVKGENDFNYGTDEEPDAMKREEFDCDTDEENEADVALRPSPVQSAPVKSEEVYGADTDTEEEGKSASDNAQPSPVTSTQVKQEEEIVEDKKTKSDWASAVICYCAGRWRQGWMLSHQPRGEPSDLKKVPRGVIGHILGYLAYDAKNLPTMRAVQQTCKLFHHLFSCDDFTRELLFPKCFLVPYEDTGEDNEGKLNLWEGEMKGIKCGNQGSQLGTWHDIKKERDAVDDFVWWDNAILPRKTYMFWSTINECKTWGDVRTKYTKGFYRALMDMYQERNAERGLDLSFLSDEFLQSRRFLDTKKFACTLLLYEDAIESFTGEEDYFPPSIENIQSASLGFYYDIYNGWVTDSHGETYLKVEGKEMDEIVAAIKESGSTAQYEPGLSQFRSVYD